MELLSRSSGAIETPVSRARCNVPAASSRAPKLGQCSSAAATHRRGGGGGVLVLFPKKAKLLARNGTGLLSCSFAPAHRIALLSGRRNEFSEHASSSAGEAAEVKGKVDAVKAEEQGEEAEGDGRDPAGDSDEDLGIDEDGNVQAGLPPEFLELMKDEGTPVNYWLLGSALLVLFLARKIIWQELKRWGRLAGFGGVVVFDLVAFAFAKLVTLGGKPLQSVVIAIACVILTVNNIFRFVAGIIPPLPVLYSVTLSSVVLLVGESVSDTYASPQNEFPSRRILDIAGVLGLSGLVGLIPGEMVLLGLTSITIFLLLVRKVNPVAGFTPAVGVFAAVSVPIVRYPVLLSFLGSCLYRYWKLGYLSQGAVPKERTAEYPLVLKGMIYLVGISFSARVFFATFDFVRAGISVARA